MSVYCQVLACPVLSMAVKGSMKNGKALRQPVIIISMIVSIIVSVIIVCYVFA